MKILPVIDLMNGQVVRGVAGRRAEYKPIVSRLTKSTDPVDIASAFREHFGFDEIYVADLDAIVGKPPALSTFDELHRRGFRLWVDAGLKKACDAKPLLDCGVASIVAGLETIDGPETLQDLLDYVAPARLVFSLDLKAGQPLTHNDAWLASHPTIIVDQAVNRGVRRILVLDLAQVGLGAGVGTEPLCRRLRTTFAATVEITAGGGVRGRQDVEIMRRAGVDWLLIASALHDGRLTHEHVKGGARAGNVINRGG